MSRILQFTEQLIAQESVTPKDEQCQDLIVKRLQPLGFECETIASGPDNFRVTNLWAIKRSHQPKAQTLVFAGHTDVVPTGPLEQWNSHPFKPTHRDGKLYGRGASDMKTSLAAMVIAVEDFLTAQQQHDFNIAFLLTSDEEGPAYDGTVKVCEALQARKEKLDWCIVGEPTSVNQTGDMVKNGRRGTMSGKLTIKGVQGHIAYPQMAKNPIHLFAPALNELVGIEWDKGNSHFQPTSWQVSNMHSGTGANNVIPGSCVLDFNFRFSTESTIDALQTRLTQVLNKHKLDFDLNWTVGGLPFLTPEGDFLDLIKLAIRQATGIETEISTTGGTSDGRFIAQICPQVIEVGPPNASIHKIDEHIRIVDMEPLQHIYVHVLRLLQQRTSSVNAST
ncbi:MAG: succinyl-diaminopimelate desuccinylase [Burkholderiaceae bacterium]